MGLEMYPSLRCKLLTEIKNFSFTALQISDWNRNTLCKGLKSMESLPSVRVYKNKHSTIPSYKQSVTNNEINNQGYKI